MRVRGALAGAVAMMGAFALGSAANAGIVESTDVSTATKTGTLTDYDLDANRTYLITVSGVANIGNSYKGAVLADGDFFGFNGFDPKFDGTNGVNIGLAINGVVPDWVATDMANTYTFLISGVGGKLLLQFIDVYYKDNDPNGFLRIVLEDVTETPLPGAAVLFGSALAAGGAWRRRKKA